MDNIEDILTQITDIESCQQLCQVNMYISATLRDCPPGNTVWHPPLWQHHCDNNTDNTTVTTALWQHNCDNTTVTIPMWQHHSDNTTVTTPLWQHQCDNTNVTTPLWQHHCGNTTVVTPLWQHHCDNTTCDNTTLTTLLWQHHCDNAAVTTALPCKYVHFKRSWYCNSDFMHVFVTTTVLGIYIVSCTVQHCGHFHSRISRAFVPVSVLSVQPLLRGQQFEKIVTPKYILYTYAPQFYGYYMYSSMYVHRLTALPGNYVQKLKDDRC